MSDPDPTAADPAVAPAEDPTPDVNSVCPVCGARLTAEKCKVVCRSARCGYRIILTCAEF